MEGRFSFRSALIGGLVAALLVSAVPVVAAVGDAILAGKTTRADATTHLKGDVASHNLRITNTNAGGTAARFAVEPGNPPFQVNSKTRVPMLNADRLDGKNSSAFLTKNGYDPDRDGSVLSADTVAGTALGDILPGGTLPAGSTIRGVWALGGDAGYLMEGVPYGFTLAQPPTVHYIAAGGVPPAQCPGSSALPQAAPGHLCVYAHLVSGIAAIDIVAGNGALGSSSFGFFLGVTPGDVTNSTPLAYGSWAVTAPAAGAAPAPQDATGSIFGE